MSIGRESTTARAIARPLRLYGEWMYFRRPARRRFPEHVTEQLADGFFWLVLPIAVPGVSAFFSLFLESFPTTFLHTEERFESPAEMRHRSVNLGPERAVADVRGNPEVHTNLGDGLADGTAAHLRFEFFQRRHAEMHGIVGIDARGAVGFRARGRGGAEFHRQRLDIFCLGGAGGLSRLDIAALRGAGEQKLFQHHRAENAALHMRENAADVVGAEAVGKARKMPVFGAIGEGAVEVFAVAQQGSDDV